ncbi:DODA-type extradiol aromatic ring-opening family dioxygenase [Paenibacillus whitsoniae]|uniref:Dioxygenase n=1 Tax=Paenibacillus whitsoniae TaxID=2496558 RepID=A0A430JFN1_9BACL|nr:class III extradiol ring-cleavage dioxygenase [Paenibacillus whitsoniae]RTE09830.1 dioxygenase [Paenibacillus whitsoniae]
MLPTFFISHGHPGLAAQEDGFTAFLLRLSGSLPKPQAIVLFSAGWESSVQKISTAIEPVTLHGGAAEADPFLALHQYPAKGELTLSLHIKQLLENEGIGCETDDERGVDFCAWGPLSILYPDANIPLVMLSVNPRLTAEEQYRIGAALGPLREHEVLIVGSGGTVYNLAKLDENNPVPPEWAVAFEEWVAEQLETWNVDALFRYDERAPYVEAAVPLPGHFAPLLLAMGAGEASRRAKLLHHSFQLGALSLSCWMFGGMKLEKK